MAICVVIQAIGVLKELSELTVIIPARNEERSLPRIIVKIINSITKRVIVVDNDSSDGTSEVAQNVGATVIQEKQLGYGSACLAGIKYASSLLVKPKYICFFDADGQSRVDDIIKVANPVLIRKTNYCQGSRMIMKDSRNALTPMARIANHLFANILSKLWKQNITDLGPLRVMTWNTLRNLEMKSTGFGWTIEMSTKIMKLGKIHYEVPVIYKKRTMGKSKISGNLTTATKAAFVMVITFLSVLFSWRPTSGKII